MCDCNNEADKPEAEMKKRIAKRAAVLFALLPDEQISHSLTDRKVANLLLATRSFAAECTLAVSWTMEKIVSYNTGLELAEAALEFAAASTKQAECGAAKKTCRTICDINDEGYFCYFDCRLEYVVCLASSIWKAAKAD